MGGEDFDKGLDRRLLLEVAANFFVDAFEVGGEVFGDEWVLLGVVHDDEVIGFLASHLVEHVQKDDVVVSAVVEGVQGLGRVEGEPGAWPSPLWV